ncbi:MAG: LysM peptidoglycan-binding domain-containing protein [Pseudomonadota bacterium]
MAATGRASQRSVLIIGGVTVSAVALLAVLLLQTEGEAPRGWEVTAVAPHATAPAPATPQRGSEPVTVADAPPADPEEMDAPEAAPQEAEQTARADAVTDGAEPEPDMARPSFDTVRVEADGAALLAGRAAPGADIDILLDGALLAAVTADGGGRFAAFVTVPASEATQSLTLMARKSGQELASLNALFVEPVVPRVAGAPQAIAMAEPTVEQDAPDEIAPTVPATGPAATAMAEESGPAPTGVSRSDAPEALASLETGDAPEIASQAAAPLTSAAPATAEPRVLLADEDGLRVVQSPNAMTSVALDTITYDDAGDVSLGGRGEGAGFVRIYLDDEPITTSPIAPDGSWRTALPDVDTGIYTLRVDEVSTEGEVTSRVETPFKREDPEVVAELAAEEPPTETGIIEMATVDPGALETGAVALGALRPDVMTVQPGSTLWAMARETYGRGILYVKVFEANRDRIRDPDLIYPGQVFDMPE